MCRYIIIVESRAALTNTIIESRLLIISNCYINGLLGRNQRGEWETENITGSAGFVTELAGFGRKIVVPPSQKRGDNRLIRDTTVSPGGAKFPRFR